MGLLLLTEETGGQSRRDTVASQMPRIGCDDCCVVAGGFEPAGGVTMDSGGVLYNYTVKVPVQPVSLVF